MNKDLQHTRGGHYIAEGSYGCAFAPRLKCKTTASDKKVPKKATIGKVFDDVQELKFESKTAKFLKSIDPHNEFTVPFYGECRTDSDIVKKSDEIDNCTLIQDHKHDVPQLIYGFGGDDLDIVVDNIHGKYENLKFDKVIMLFRSVIKGLLKLNKRGYAHSDLKPNNMLYSKSDDSIKLIDFGLMKGLKEIDNDHILKYHSAFQPPEANILYYVSQGITNELDIYEKVMKNFAYYNYISMVNFLEFAKYDSKLREFINVAVTMKVPDLRRDFNTNFVNKYDIYSLGISINDIIYNLQADHGLNVVNNELFTTFLKDIVVPIIDPNPYNRSSILECYMKMEVFYNRFSGKKAVYDAVTFSKFVDIRDMRSILKKNKAPIYGNKKMLYERILALK